MPLQAQLRAAKHDSTRLRLYSELAQEYRLKAGLDSSLHYITLGVKLAKQLNNTRYNCDLYTSQAYYFRSGRQYDAAIKMVKLAIDFGKKNKQYAKVERANYVLAVIYADKAYHTGSTRGQVITIRQLFENIRFSNQHQSFSYIANNYNLLCLIYKDNGNDSLAYVYLEKWLNHGWKLDKPYIRLVVLSADFEFNLYHKRYAKAKTSLTQLLDFNPQNDDAELYLYCLSEATKAGIKFGAFDIAYSIIQKIENNSWLMKAMTNERKMLFNSERTSVYLHQKRYALAQKTHEQAIFFSKKETPIFGDQLRLLINQQELFEYQKRFEEALVLNKRIYAMQDSLNSARFNFELAASEERLAYENKERLFNQQLKIQQLQNQRNTQRLKQSQYVLWAALLIMALLGIVVLIITLQMKQIKKQSAALKELNANKDRLFGIIGHDLRSPVIQLQMSLTAILHKISAASAEFIPLVSAQIARTTGLLATLDNLLYWSITQRDKITVCPRTTRLCDLVEEALEWLQQSGLQQEVTAHADIDPELSIIADENHLRIILRNVIQNAFKFTPEGGEVRLSTVSLDKTVTLSIQDTGPGFGNAAANDKKKGTQLGLKLVHELMHANHGTVHIESSTKGTNVKLSFPKA